MSCEQAENTNNLQRPLFVITLTEEEFAKLSNPEQHLSETLVMYGGTKVDLIIQRGM